jgi:MFS transporter, DHA1 family, inner membrane transport protein
MPSTEPGRRLTRQERLILLVLSTVQFTSIVDFMVIMPLAPELKRAIGLTTDRFALVVAAYTIAAGLAGVISTLFLDRFARRPTYLVLFTGFLVGTLACGIAPDFVTLVAARALTGAFGGILGGMAMTIIGDVFPENRRGTATGILMMSFSVASVLGVPIGLTLGQEYGWHIPFLVLAGLCVPVLILAACVLPRLDGHLTGQVREEPLAHLKQIFLEANHLRAFALMSALMISGFSVLPFLSAYLVSNVGLAEKQLRWAYVAGGIVTLVGMPAIGRMADRFGKLRVYRYVVPANAALLLTVTSLPPVPLALVLLAMSATMLSNGGRMVPAMAMITSSVVPRLRGGFMGANSAVQHLSSSLGVIVAGLILFEPPNGPIERFSIVGLMAATVSLSTLWLAGRLRLVAPAQADVALEPRQSIVSTADPREQVLKLGVPPRVVLSPRDHQRAPLSARARSTN